MALTQVASGLIASVSGASLTGTQNIPKATLPTGSVLQVATNTFDNYVSTTANGNPNDITKGVQLFSVSFTPISATSTILVQTSSIVIGEESNTGDKCWLALWDGSTFIAANSGTASPSHFNSALQMAHQSLNNSYTSGSTATRTISVRAGMDGTSCYINGNSTYNNSGSSQRIQMTVWEIAA
jgi:hypothetical protein